MQAEYDSRRMNFWTLDAATKPLDGFSEFNQKAVMTVFSRYRDLVEFSVERKGSLLTLHAWGTESALRLIEKELSEAGFSSEFPEAPEDHRHLSVAWNN